MKKIKKLFLSLILFLFYSNVTNATTKGTYVIEESNAGKKLLVFIGIVLIILVIFLMYKFDKKYERNKRRSKYTAEDEESDKSGDFEEYEIEYLEDIQPENRKKTTDETIMINYAKLRKIEKEASETIKEENDNEYYNEVAEKEEIESNSQIGSTMVMNTINKDILKKEESKTIKNAQDVKIRENEDAEDLELLELEKTIKAANIKRYTRKKKKESKSNIKRYTRKIVRKQSEVSTQPPKRGRGRPRKPVVLDAEVNKVPRKRGRPRKEKKPEETNLPKRGRGRPRKNV